MKLIIPAPLAKQIRRFTNRYYPSMQIKFFGSCSEVPTKLKQDLADPGHSVSDADGHYDIDGVSYNCNEGVIMAADPRPFILKTKESHS